LRIGERVFHRSANYNPNQENIVRSQARLVRQKLESYFASEGYTEPLLLIIPKGGYTPEFVVRRTESAKADIPGERVNSLSSSLVPGLIAAVAVLGIAVAILAALLINAKELRTDARTASSPMLNALWSQLFSPSSPTMVIVPDSTVGMVQEATKEPVDLATYLRRSPNSDNQKVREIEGTLRGFSIRRYTTLTASAPR
jgi:hypothetical protein